FLAGSMVASASFSFQWASKLASDQRLGLLLELARLAPQLVVLADGFLKRAVVAGLLGGVGILALGVRLGLLVLPLVDGPIPLVVLALVILAQLAVHRFFCRLLGLVVFHAQ